jgi:23S rRNA G2445 N2-methylase RlmL
MQNNYNTENEKIKRIREKTLVIGVDIAKDAHYARVLNWRRIEVAKGINFGNTKVDSGDGSSGRTVPMS